VDRKLGPAIEERLLQLLDEHTLAGRFTERHRWVSIAMGRQRHEHELMLRVAARQCIGGELCLDHCQRAASRRQSESH
jgi:hypothetical protein